MKIVNVPLHEINPYPKNAKKHPTEQLQQILESIEEYGFLYPILIDKNNIIIAGHGRYEAAATLGMETIPCVVAEHLTPIQIKAYRILDNRIAQTGWHNDLLKLEIEELRDEGFDIENLCFDGDELTFILYSDEIPGIDEGDKKPKTKKIIICPKCDHQITS